MIVNASAATEKRDAAVSYQRVSSLLAVRILQHTAHYPDERPWGTPLVVDQMPNEEGHDGAHDQA